MSLSASIARSAARSGAFNAAASCTPLSSADGWPRVLVFKAGIEIMYALCVMALANSPRACGAASRYITVRPPADSPAMVTLAGSPPNAWMLSLTQRSAAIWSIRP